MKKAEKWAENLLKKNAQLENASAEYAKNLRNSQNFIEGCQISLQIAFVT